VNYLQTRHGKLRSNLLHRYVSEAQTVYVKLIYTKLHRVSRV